MIVGERGQLICIAGMDKVLRNFTWTSTKQTCAGKGRIFWTKFEDKNVLLFYVLKGCHE